MVLFILKVLVEPENKQQNLRIYIFVLKNTYKRQIVIQRQILLHNVPKCHSKHKVIKITSFEILNEKLICNLQL